MVGEWTEHIPHGVRSHQFITALRTLLSGGMVEGHSRELTATRPVRSRAAAYLASTFTIRTQIKAPTSSVPVPLWRGSCCRAVTCLAPKDSSKLELPAVRMPPLESPLFPSLPLHMCQNWGHSCLGAPPYSKHFRSVGACQHPVYLTPPGMPSVNAVLLSAVERC